MTVSALIIVLLSNHGYWFGGHEEIITARRAAKGELLAADLTFDLMLDNLRLAGGKLPLADGLEDASVKLTIPEVRIRLSMKLVYQILRRDNGAELEKGEIPVEVFPDDLLKHLPRLLDDKKLTVVDHPDGLANTLKHAGVKFIPVDSLAKLQTLPADLILIGKDMLDPSTAMQAPLCARATQVQPFASSSKRASRRWPAALS